MSTTSFRSIYIRERIDSGELNEKSATIIQSVFKRIGLAENALGINIEDRLSREEYIALFEKLGISRINYFRNIHAIISVYFQWLKNTGRADPDMDVFSSFDFQDLNLEGAFDQKYYKDFQSMQDRINDTLIASGRIDEDIFATQIAMIYLAWSGVKIEDAIQIKKTDVYEDHIVVNGSIIYPNNAIMHFLNEYRDAVGYTSQARHVIYLKYAQSEYLIRTVRRDQLTPKNASFLLAAFSKSFVGLDAKNFDTAFSYAKIYWSGVFHRAYLYECVNGTIQKNDVETINRVFGMNYKDATKANMCLKDYLVYKECFFPSR